MFKKLLYSVIGDPNDKAIKRYMPVVEEINALEPTFEACATRTVSPKHSPP